MTNKINLLGIILKKLSIKIFSSLMCIYQKFWKNVTLLILIQIHTERAVNHLITKCCKK